MPQQQSSSYRRWMLQSQPGTTRGPKFRYPQPPVPDLASETAVVLTRMTLSRVPLLVIAPMVIGLLTMVQPPARSMHEHPLPWFGHRGFREVSSSGSETSTYSRQMLLGGGKQKEAYCSRQP